MCDNERRERVMKVAVIGAGLMGKEAARDLIKNGRITEVGVADIDVKRAEQVCRALAASKLTPYRVDANDIDELIRFFQNFDLVVNALFYTFNMNVVTAALASRVHVVDFGGHIAHITDKVLTLDEEAKNARITIIPDLGVAPGMTNILVGYGAKKIDRVESIRMYVGGIPVQPEPPLEYNQVFSMDGVLDLYSDPALIIRNGIKQEVPALSEIETVYFDRFGPLEAFHTSGGTSTLPLSFPDVNELEYKTIRYRGHAEKMKLLVDLNLTKRDYEVEINGKQIKPRDVLLKVLDPIVALKDKDDVVLLRVIVSGEKNHKKTTYTYEMQTYKDRENGVTAMAKATAYTVSAVAQMIVDQTITKTGVHPPERIVPGEKYIEEMKKREVHITERKQSFF